MNSSANLYIPYNKKKNTFLFYKKINEYMYKYVNVLQIQHVVGHTEIYFFNHNIFL
uniref:Uncharacterized protein n=1 Tax=Anguilla anguilla TaxID=7936 RepID=A0A0E9XNB4_ANGAN